MELSDYLRILRAHWIGILAILAIGIAGAGGWSLLQPRVYTADASGFVAAQGATDLGTSMVGNQLAQSKVKSYLDIGTWRSVAEFAIKELNLTATPDALVRQVKVTNPANTVILQVSANGPTPSRLATWRRSGCVASSTRSNRSRPAAPDRRRSRSSRVIPRNCPPRRVRPIPG